MDELSELVGQELAGFKVASFLGEGGMAAVFRGENSMNPEIVRALKVVRPELSARKEFVQRFTKEALFLEKLQHDSIVRFYGLRQEKKDGLTLLIMELELLEGMALAEWVERLPNRAVGVSRAVELMLQAARGVAAAHSRGIVHRDLKPENLFVTKEGTIKVLDFGIARARDDAGRESRLTRAGTMPGTPAYMAPEVWLGEVPTEPADVYALGLTLFELLLGRHPMDDGNALQSVPRLMNLHVNAALPRLRDVVPDAPEALEELITRATHKDPMQRLPNARAFADALEAIRRDGSPDDGRTSVDVPLFPTEEDAGFAKTALAPPRTEIALGGREGATVPATPIEAGSGTAPMVPVRERTRTTGAALIPQQRRRSRSLLVPALLGGAVVVGVVGYVAFKPGPRRVSSTRSNANDDDDKPSAKPRPSAPTASSAPAVVSAPVATSPPITGENRWVQVQVPTEPWLLGVPDGAQASVKGFRAKAGVRTSSVSFEMQQHEVTWGELDPWLARNARVDDPVSMPAWLPGEPAARAALPATGVSLTTAAFYCDALGGSLPTEEQWELAARGPERKPNPWGDAAPTSETLRTGTQLVPVAPVMTTVQDRSSSDPEHAIFDLAGNAMEWTADGYREDQTGALWSEARKGERVLYAVRGIQIGEGTPPPPLVSGAHRIFACGSGKCPLPQMRIRQYIGFRCVRALKGTRPR